MGKLFTSAIALALTLVMVASATPTNAGPTWNEFAEQYHFYGYPASAQATFGDCYYGENFTADFDSILNRVGEAMARPIRPIGDDDIFNTTLENWGL